ncbi:Rieske 2Fe-2S domain-containing protein [Streptomyces sp. NPDC091217]|uniref:Rieske 2Fe-2S domain-containing protein n=1 Tax=Streptomyces sp. NPDC091217 TaxID=3365975 RepID=UPI003808C229
MADTCRRRPGPLSMGRLDGDNPVCGYHGIAYGPNGCCPGCRPRRRSTFRRP